ncbi:MAG: hypothetical protein WCC27_02830 [Acidobacteriaceae bacterium]
MTHSGKLSWIAAALLVTTCAARAATPPADPCTLLSAAEVSRTMSGSYSPPEESVAPRPYANTAEGKDCHYRAMGGELLFRIYYDPSPDEATKLFAQLRMFYSPSQPVTGVGDEAYFDSRHGLHARKGNVRFYLQGSGSDERLTELAQVVAKKL